MWANGFLNGNRSHVSLFDVLYARGEIGIGLERLYHLMQIVDKLENVALSTTLYSWYAFYEPTHKVVNVKYV